MDNVIYKQFIAVKLKPNSIENALDLFHRQDT